MVVVGRNADVGDEEAAAACNGAIALEEEEAVLVVILSFDKFQTLPVLLPMPSTDVVVCLCCCACDDENVDDGFESLDVDTALDFFVILVQEFASSVFQKKK